MSLKSKYEKSLSERWCVRFKTKHPDGDHYDGIVTHIKPKFIVLREEWDFEFDGTIVLPKRFIAGVRDGKLEWCSNAIIRWNGAIRRSRAAPWLNSCDSLGEVLAALMERDIWPGIETLTGEHGHFFIGPLSKVERDKCWLRCYDATGEWEREYDLDYDEIFRIEFDSRYCKTFNAYMRAKNGPRLPARS